VRKVMRIGAGWWLVLFLAAAVMAGDEQARDRSFREELPGVFPVWHQLERLTAQQRANAEIMIHVDHDPSGQLAEMAGRVERSWNAGECDAALNLFRELTRQTSNENIELGISWRTPVAAPNIKRANDVLINEADSIYIVAYDIDHKTGNMFAILLQEGGGTVCRLSINFSTDGGLTWAETFSWAAYFMIDDMDAVVIGDYCFMGFIRGSNQYDLWVFRFNVSDGMLSFFPSAEYWEDVAATVYPVEFDEVALCSNEDDAAAAEDHIYVAAITSEGDLKCYWSDVDADIWTEIPTGVSDADRGLDICFNEGTTGNRLMASYVNTADNLNIDGYASGTGWSNTLETTVYWMDSKGTAITAYRDTISCVYEYYGSLMQYIKCASSNDGGATYDFDILDDTTVFAECPAIAGRRGGGVMAVYRFYSFPRTLHMAWQPYGGEWSQAVEFGDYEPYYTAPAVEYIGDGIYGCVYADWGAPGRQAYFIKRSNCCKLAGDANSDGLVNVGDAIYVVNYVFKDGPEPSCMAEGDANADGLVNVGDAIHVVNYVFKDGPDPICPN